MLSGTISRAFAQTILGLLKDDRELISKGVEIDKKVA